MCDMSSSATCLTVDGLELLSSEGRREHLMRARLRRRSYSGVTAAAAHCHSLVSRRWSRSDVNALGTSLVTLYKARVNVTATRCLPKTMRHTQHISHVPRAAVESRHSFAQVEAAEP